jgi:hypothetical protein
VIWLYSGKVLLTMLHALFWELELPFSRTRYINSLKSFHSIEQMQNALTSHYNYRNDPLAGCWDFYYLPHITWALGRGDCDDFALMAADALSRRGIPAIMVSFIPAKIVESHVIVVYRDRSAWRWCEVGIWHNRDYPDADAAIVDATDIYGGARALHMQSFIPIHKTGQEFIKC